MTRELVIGSHYKQIQLKSGDVYIGWVNDEKKPKRHGGGHCTYKSTGEEYTGGFREDVRFGHGRLKKSNGDTYEGSFHNDVIDGFGIYKHADGTEYRGEFKDGLRQGRGVLKSKDGTTYEGQFYNGEKSGKGILTKEGSKKTTYGYWENDNMTRELDKAEVEELIGRKEAGNEDAYEYYDYGGDDGEEGDDGRSCTSLFGWDAIRVFFGGEVKSGSGGPVRRRRRKKEKKQEIRRASTVDGRPMKDANATENAKRRIGVSAESSKDVDDGVATPVHPKTQEDYKRIEDIMKAIFIFKSCTSEQLDEVIKAMFPVVKAAGEVIIKQGEEGDNFYVLEEGEAHAFKRMDGSSEEKKVATFAPGGSFGELSLLYSQPRAATVRAITKCSLWALDRSTFRKILVTASTSRAKQLEAFLNKVKILDPLTQKEKAELADAMTETKEFRDGEYIITQGERGDSFFVIMEGSARITKSSKPGKAGKEKDLAVVTVGDYFGEMAILSDQPRAASVIAKGKCKCLTLDRDTFTRLLGPAESVLKQKMTNYDK